MTRRPLPGVDSNVDEGSRTDPPSPDPYAAFAADYEWLFDHEALTGAPFLGSYETTLNSLPHGARILDAACGIGVEALALARLGFEVVAADASPAMVVQTRERARLAGVDLPVVRATWEELPTCLDREFDLVVCNGNSLVHATGAEARAGALSAFRSLLAEGGRVVIGTRDFEVLRSTRPAVEVAPHPNTRDGVTCVPFYTWDIPDGWEQPHVATVHLALVRDESIEHRHHKVEFYPYTGAELDEALLRAGLEVTSSTRDGHSHRYVLTAAARQQPNQVQQGEYPCRTCGGIPPDDRPPT